MPTMSRQEMEQVIRDGGSVLHRNRIINSLEHLPTDAALAKASNDPARVDAAKGAIDAQIKALQDARDSLGDPAADAELRAKADADAKAKADAESAAKKKAEDDAKKGK